MQWATGEPMIATQRGLIRLTPKLQPNEMKWNPTFWSAHWSGCHSPTKAVSFHMSCLPFLSLSLLFTLRSTFANIIVFSIYVLLSKIHLQLGPRMVNSLPLYLFEDYMQKHIGLKFRRWLQISLLIRRYDGWVSHTDTTRHFSHQAFTDENEWCSLKEVAFGINYVG